MLFQNQQNSFQAAGGGGVPGVGGGIMMAPGSRPGILRNKLHPHGGQIGYAQALASHPHDASMDSIGREKLHVNIDRYQANQDIGENDPLLISDDSTPAVAGSNGIMPAMGSVGPNPGPMIFQNAPSAGIMPNHSPPLHQAVAGGGGGSHIMYLPHNANFNPHCPTRGMYPMGNINSNSNPNNPINHNNPTHTYSGSTSSASSSPAIYPGGGYHSSSSSNNNHQVTFAPTSDIVTYKRSLSVIANPEGEGEDDFDNDNAAINDDATEPNVPRFSQLLPDSDDQSLVPQSNLILRMAHEHRTAAMDSPQRETTRQTRTPSERLQLRLPPNATPGGGATPDRDRHQLLNTYHHPVYTGEPSSHSSDSNDPEHCIMDLKEHQLAESLSLLTAAPHPPYNSTNTSGETMLKHMADTPLNLEDFTASTEQTDMKTLVGDDDNDTVKDMPPFYGNKYSNNTTNIHPSGATTTQDAKLLRHPSGEGTEPTRAVISEVDPNAPVEQSSRPLPLDRRRTPSGGSHVVPSLAERHHVPSGNKHQTQQLQRSCLKNSNSNSNSCLEGVGVHTDVNRRPQKFGRGVSFEDDNDHERRRVGGSPPSSLDTNLKQIEVSTVPLRSSGEDDQNHDDPDLNCSTVLKKATEECLNEEGRNNNINNDCDDEDNDKENVKLRSTSNEEDTELSSLDSTQSSPPSVSSS